MKPTYKPNFVGCPKATGNHSSRPTVADRLKRSTRKSRFAFAKHSAGRRIASGTSVAPDGSWFSCNSSPDTAATAEAAGKAAVAGAKPLSQNAYKVTLAKVAVKRALLDAVKTAKA